MPEASRRAVSHGPFPLDCRCGAELMPEASQPVAGGGVGRHHRKTKPNRNPHRQGGQLGSADTGWGGRAGTLLGCRRTLGRLVPVMARELARGALTLAPFQGATLLSASGYPVVSLRSTTGYRLASPRDGTGGSRWPMPEASEPVVGRHHRNTKSRRKPPRQGWQPSHHSPPSIPKAPKCWGTSRRC